MGLVLLDLNFRIERAFQVRIPSQDWAARMGIQVAGDDLTLGQYHEIVLGLCEEQGVSPPADSRRRIQHCVSDAAGLDVDEVTPDLWLIQDIAPYG